MTTVTLTRGEIKVSILAGSHSDFMKIVEGEMPPGMTYVVHPLEDDERQPTADFPHGVAFRLVIFRPPQGVSEKHPSGVSDKHQSGVSTKQPSGVSLKLSVPPEGEHMKPRAPKSIPTRAIPDQFEYRSKKKRVGAKSLNDDVYRYVCQRAADFINETFHIEGCLLMPSRDALRDHLMRILESEFEITNSYDSRGTKTEWTITDEEAEGMAARAASFALTEWDPYYFNKKSIAGSIGGSRGKRLPRLTDADLSRVDGMTKAQAAKRLKTSTATIGRLRAQAKDRPAFK